jgi:low temperature requirement protein LtrA
MPDFFMPGSVFFSIVGALAFYLAAPGQRWLRAPLAPRLFRTLAAVFSIAAFVIGASGLHPATSLAIVFIAAMACLTACPFIGVLIGVLLERTRLRGASR